MRHRWLKYSNVYINHDPVMTLTKYMARSTLVACASELGKLLKCHLKEKANRKLANGQNIEDSEKRKWPKGLSAPALELNTIIFKHVYWYMQLISGERLQDHWSSGLLRVNIERPTRSSVTMLLLPLYVTCRYKSLDGICLHCPNYFLQLNCITLIKNMYLKMSVSLPRPFKVIQRRIDGSEPFYRDWDTYKAGFGNISGEYWLGEL